MTDVHPQALRPAACGELLAQRVQGGEGRCASVINTSSRGQGLRGNPGQLNYAAAKAGIAIMSVVAACELERYGVRVNAIAPVGPDPPRPKPPPPGDRIAVRRPDGTFDIWSPANVTPLVPGWLRRSATSRPGLQHRRWPCRMAAGMGRLVRRSTWTGRDRGRARRAGTPSWPVRPPGVPRDLTAGGARESGERDRISSCRVSPRRRTAASLAVRHGDRRPVPSTPTSRPPAAGYRDPLLPPNFLFTSSSCGPIRRAPPPRHRPARCSTGAAPPTTSPAGSRATS
ncbi:SDR family NAD(P)-dependent oxidoreductase [Pseudonocardia sp. MCCB 268]|nr:SDR family NAD(P)-dependent oxidoreductase [Pseudonocardia cytotoxica]